MGDGGVGTNAGDQNMLDPSNHLNLITLDIVSLTSLAFHRVWVVDVTSRSSLTLRDLAQKALIENRNKDDLASIHVSASFDWLLLSKVTTVALCDLQWMSGCPIQLRWSRFLIPVYKPRGAEHKAWHGALFLNPIIVAEESQRPLKRIRFSWTIELETIN